MRPWRRALSSPVLTRSADALVLLFCDPGRDCDHKLAGGAYSPEVRLTEADVFGLVAAECLDVLERLGYPFPAESVDGPCHQEVELAARCRREHGLELLPVVAALAGGAVHVLGGDSPSARLAETAKLDELVRGVLAFIFGGNAGVEGGAMVRNPWGHAC